MAEANYQIAAATADDDAAHAWAENDGSARAAFFAAYADADLAWLNDVAAAYITDKTGQAQADADDADQAANLDASLSSQTAAQDGSLAVTQAQFDQTELDAVAGDERTFALTQTSEYGTDIAGRMAALRDRAIASAQETQSWEISRAQETKSYDVAVATNGATKRDRSEWHQIKPQPPFPAMLCAAQRGCDA